MNNQDNQELSLEQQIEAGKAKLESLNGGPFSPEEIEAGERFWDTYRLVMPVVHVDTVTISTHPRNE